MFVVVVVVKDGVQKLLDVWFVKVQGRFREEVDKFIEAATKHATTLKENNDTIICPCKDCKNRMAWTDVTIIRSHLIMRGC